MKEFVEKLIERLEDSQAKIEFALKGCKVNEFIQVKAVKRIIAELAEEYNNCSIDTSTNASSGWIPCSERLPELTEGTECFKQSPCCLTTLKWWDGDMTESVGWYNQSGVWNEDSKNCKVIAWMPLPEPYQLKGE